MKKLFIVLFVFAFCAAISAQDYSFDRKCIEKMTRIKPKLGNENDWESFLYLNSQSNSYYMKESTKDNYFLTDNAKAQIIHFKNYVYSKSSLYRPVGLKNIDFSYSEKEIQMATVEKTADGNFLVKTFPIKGGKRSNLEVVFILKKSTVPLVQIKFMDLSPSVHKAVYDALLGELDNPNYEIETVKVDYRNGYHFLFDYTDCETVSLNFQFQDN